MFTTCTKIKLKPNSLEKVKEWMKFMNDHKEQVFISLEQETVFVESVFLDICYDGDYLIYFTKVKDREVMRQFSRQSNLEIEKYHQEFKQATFDTKTPLEVLIDFDRIVSD